MTPSGPDPRAVIFDLDDTLYPYRQFLLSGFGAVAAHLEARHGVSRRGALRCLIDASSGSAQGREIQVCLGTLQLPADLAQDLVDLLGDHEPVLRLPRCARQVLGRLRADGWRLGIVTNGPAVVQRRKIAALGLRPLVDAIVFATETGSGAGKPERDAFDRVAWALQVSSRRAVFVGNDVRCDVEGATAAGMLPVLCTAWTREAAVTGVPSVHCLGQVAAIARERLEEAERQASGNAIDRGPVTPHPDREANCVA